jgi:hypothetical protein
VCVCACVHNLSEHLLGREKYKRPLDSGCVQQNFFIPQSYINTSIFPTHSLPYIARDEWIRSIMDTVWGVGGGSWIIISRVSVTRKASPLNQIGWATPHCTSTQLNTQFYNYRQCCSAMWDGAERRGRCVSHSSRSDNLIHCELRYPPRVTPTRLAMCGPRVISSNFNYAINHYEPE